MKSSTRADRALWAWLVVGLVLAVGFAGAVAFRPAMRALGLEVTGVASTVPPTLLSPPPSPPASPPIGTGVIAAAEPLEEGPPPAMAVLQERLQALDTTALRAAEGAQVTTAWSVVDLATGEVLSASAADQPLIPASTTKLLTVAAALSAFDGSETFATRVLAPEPGRLVLVGGGDPLLTSEPVDPGTYPAPPSLRELAGLTAEALQAEGTTSVTLGYDSTLFVDDGWNDTWPENYRDQVTPITALWADEGRDPTTRVRSRDPDLLATTTFAAQLREAGIAVGEELVPAEATGVELARVESLPLHVLAEQAMLRSNNSFTEVIGFQLALATDEPATFAGSVAAVEQQLRLLGLWEESAVIRDASGLSRSNLVPAGMLARVMRHVATEPRLSVVMDGLPVAGATGTLRERFADDIAAPARGIARAKTGALSFVATLAGTTVTADQRPVAYAFMTNGSPDGWAGRVWVDQGVGVVTNCGC